MARSRGDWTGGAGEGVEITDTDDIFFLVDDVNLP